MGKLTNRKRQLRCEAELEKIDALLWKKAWETWKRLPPNVQIWMDPDDLHMEAVIVALGCFESWRPSQAKFISYVFTSVDNRLNTLISFWLRRKRQSGITVEVETIDHGQRWRPGTDLLRDAVLTALFSVES